MRYAIIAAILCTLLSSCLNKPELRNEKLILGNWVEVTDSRDLSKNSPSPRLINRQGFTFNKDFTYIKYPVFFRYDSLTQTRIYSKAPSTYTIDNNYLFLDEPGNKKSNNLRIITLTKDSLRLEEDQSPIAFIHYKNDQTNAIKFDKIYLSATGCYGSCQALDIMIGANDSVLFNGKYLTTIKGWYTGKISKDVYEQLLSNFQKVNYDSLKTAYYSNWSDGQTVCVTFVKDNRIYKSVLDYSRQAPFIFTWAYIPLQFLYQTIKLNKIPNPDSIPPFETLCKFHYTKHETIVRIKESEQFLLTDYLHQGKKVNISFQPRYKLINYYPKSEIKTDGRYYTFTINGKQQTIDIGFNFIDVNNKNWKWVNPNDSDF